MTLLLDLNKWCTNHVGDAAAANVLDYRNPAKKSIFHSTRPSFGIFDNMINRKPTEKNPSNPAMVDIIRKNAKLPSSGGSNRGNDASVGSGEFASSEQGVVTFHDLLGGKANPNGSGLLGGVENAQGADIERQQYNDFIATEKSNFDYYLENSNLSARVKRDCRVCMAEIFEYIKKNQVDASCLTEDSEDAWLDGKEICRWIYRYNSGIWMSKNQEKFLLNAFNHYRAAKGLATWSASGGWYE